MKTAADFSLVPTTGRCAYHVYSGMNMVGTVEKNVTGNWVARDIEDRKLSEARPVLGGERMFDYFATRKAAVMAICNQST